MKPRIVTTMKITVECENTAIAIYEALSHVPNGARLRDAEVDGHYVGGRVEADVAGNVYLTFELTEEET